jgi:hypothetical protein
LSSSSPTTPFFVVGTNTCFFAPQFAQKQQQTTAEKCNHYYYYSMFKCLSGNQSKEGCQARPFSSFLGLLFIMNIIIII